MPIHLELITPDKILYRQEVSSITVMTKNGEITVLPNHVPLVTELAPGVARVDLGSSSQEIAISGGFMTVEKGGRVRILADSAERGEDLDISVIEEAKERARKLMTSTIHHDDEQFARAAAELERELARYRVALKHRRTKSEHRQDGT
jgi:F-type H+-transporting ATPase subunit epsilon